jgi:diaminopimelate decarboxylase
VDRLTDLARVYGTPLYVYRLDRVRRAAEDLRAALPAGSRLYYSLKANPHPDIVRELIGMGLHAEISSVGELGVLDEIGGSGRGGLYTGPGKTWQETVAAIRGGIRQFSVESLADRDRLAAAADACRTDVDYLVRLNGSGTAGSGLRMTGRASPFGVDLADGTAISALFRPAGRARPIGAHVFAATNVVDEDALIQEFELTAGTVASTLDAAGASPELVDLGGGFGAPFACPGSRPRYVRLRGALEDILDRTFPGWRAGEPRIAFE